MNRTELLNRLAAQKVFPPDSEKLRVLEASLYHYFGKEYQRYINQPVSFRDIGVDPASGPMFIETDSLLAEHYDETPLFFDAFLDKKFRAYTMAWYGETAAEARAADISLDEAQLNKMRLIAERAQIQGNERILNIGCGFASLETYLLSQYPDLEIVGVTPSRVQADYIASRRTNPADPLARRFSVLEKSIEAVSLADVGGQAFNLVISVGFMEHVNNVSALFQHIDTLLVPGGRSFHHFIVTKEIIPQFVGVTPQFINPEKTLLGKYFPGGRLYTFEGFSDYTAPLGLENKWYINGMNYWRTLSHWQQGFWKNIDTLAEHAFKLDELIYWHNYFHLCKGIFYPLDGDFMGVGHFLYKKIGA